MCVCQMQSHNLCCYMLTIDCWFLSPEGLRGAPFFEGTGGGTLLDKLIVDSGS